ncbi:glycoside hydrolase family 30 protein [Algibacter lectus]|uniref:Glucosylceramidase n=1 Tax=Algibacter lectus TaxID=221126 RepID=A0A4R8MJ04_9FLAO|nr:glycoside hydrolase family 30 beta sandwich domain-containing protein [Algibacter lectus]MWW25001.1 glycosyl hydrolase family 30 [Algibacter lectus]TDY64587.1 glucosylceramidase [Algibacter lectus]
MKSLQSIKLSSSYLIILVFVLLSQTHFAQNVELTYTTASKRWVKAKKFLQKTNENTSANIKIYADSLLQEVDGIGGAFNELGWEAINTLDADSGKDVINALFSKEGCNFSMCRIPIGASDYALSYYSHNDVPEDFVMRDFNIDRDRYILIPYLKAALKARPDLKIWASPWTPPAWMKVNEHYSLRAGDWNNRANGNRMDPGAQILSNATAFKMQDQYLKAYALYFSKFIQAYKKEGVDLFSIQPQNEIAYAPNWPSCTWRAEDFSIFIGDYLGPKLEEDGLDTEIWLGTINWSKPDYVRTILDNKKAAKYIKGVGFQWGGSNAIPAINKEYPDLKYMQTENKCGEGENDWTSFDRSWETLVHFFNNKAGSHMYWNMVLDETGKSAWGWPQNSMVVIDKQTKKVTYTDEFYLFKHLSHFVQPGDHYLKSSEGKNHLAFRLKDGRTLVLLNNPEDKKQNVNLELGTNTITVSVEAKSINTIIITK